MAVRERQAAAICHRRAATGIEFLLVRTMDERWTFPKGDVDPGHTEVEAAAQEAWEEAGAIGTTEGAPFTTYFYSKGRGEQRDGREIEVAAFLLHVTRQEHPPESYRRPQWFSPEQAGEALAAGRSQEQAQEFARVIRAALDQLEG